MVGQQKARIKSSKKMTAGQMQNPNENTKFTRHVSNCAEYYCVYCEKKLNTRGCTLIYQKEISMNISNATQRIRDFLQAYKRDYRKNCQNL